MRPFRRHAGCVLVKDNGWGVNDEGNLEVTATTICEAPRICLSPSAQFSVKGMTGESEYNGLKRNKPAA